MGIGPYHPLRGLPQMTHPLPKSRGLRPLAESGAEVRLRPHGQPGQTVGVEGRTLNGVPAVEAGRPVAVDP